MDAVCVQCAQCMHGRQLVCSPQLLPTSHNGNQVEQDLCLPCVVFCSQVLAATNRPAAIDSAIMRPGRLDVQLMVPPPDKAGRLQVRSYTFLQTALKTSTNNNICSSAYNYSSNLQSSMSKLCKLPSFPMHAPLQTLQIHTRNMPLAEDVVLEAVAEDTESFSGAVLLRQSFCEF